MIEESDEGVAIRLVYYDRSLTAACTRRASRATAAEAQRYTGWILLKP